jgi:hypothetical protein
MGQKAEKKREVERRKAAAAKKQGASATPNNTSTTTQSARSSESSTITATAASAKRRKKATVPKSSAQARSTTRSTRSSSRSALEVTSLGHAVVVTSAPDRDDTVQGSNLKEGRPARPKAAAAIRYLVEQVKTLDTTEDSDTNSDDSDGHSSDNEIGIVGRDDIEGDGLGSDEEDYEEDGEDPLVVDSDEQSETEVAARPKPKDGKTPAARMAIAKGRVMGATAGSRTQVKDEGSESSESDLDDGKSCSISCIIVLLTFGLSQTFSRSALRLLTFRGANECERGSSLRFCGLRCNRSSPKS